MAAKQWRIRPRTGNHYVVYKFELLERGTPIYYCREIEQAMRFIRKRVAKRVFEQRGVH